MLARFVLHEEDEDLHKDIADEDAVQIRQECFHVVLSTDAGVLDHEAVVNCCMENVRLEKTF